MDELLEVSQTHLVEPAFEEIFHSLHVVVGDLLYVLDSLCVVVGEVAVDVAQRLGVVSHTLAVICFPLTAFHQFCGESDEILHLYADAVFYQCPFGEVTGQGLTLGAVASVDGRHGIETVHYHGVLYYYPK